MRNNLNFKPKSIQEAEDYYKKIHMAPEQKNIVLAMTKLFAQYLPIPERALSGFMWRNIKDWQIQHQKDLSEIVKATPAERINVAQEIFNLFGESLKRILVSEEQEPILNETIVKGMKIYKEQFANR